MNIAIVYDSHTGTTAKAAQRMGDALEEKGHQCQVQSVTDADPAVVSTSDLICIGSWVQGLFIIFQHPTKETMQFINQLGNLEGKRAVVFCTYMLAPGSTLRKMAKVLEKKGAKVEGQFEYRGPRPDSEFAAFVSSLN
jgi:flavodoxin